MTTPDQRNTLATMHEGVRAMRHSIQHADERMTKEDRVPEGEPLYPALTNDGVYFAGFHLLYGELGGMVIHVWLMAESGMQAATLESDSEGGLNRHLAVGALPADRVAERPDVPLERC